MREYIVTCCSTADMSRTFMETNEVPFAMFHYQLDGKEYADDLYSSISPEVFYKMIGDGAQPVTSQVNAEAYCALFEPVLKSGKDVLHLTLSSGISGFPCGFFRLRYAGGTDTGEPACRNVSGGKCSMDRGASQYPASLVFLHGFNQLYPWRKSFQNRRIFRKDAQYLSSAECEFRGQTDSAQ